MSRSAAAVQRVIKAYDVRGLVGEEIDDAFVREVGASFARLMRDGENSTQAVLGYDMRASSPVLAAAFAEGVMDQGLDVVRIGLASTDQLYFASGLLNCPGAMFTASHNPAAYNGIKLCRAGAKPVGKDTGLTTISDEVIEGVPGYDGTRGTLSDRDVLVDYGQFLRSLVDVGSLRPLNVAVDAGNGMAGHTTPAVLGPIPSMTVFPLYFELDGTFPNHEANPLKDECLEDLRKAVAEQGAEVGFAYDGVAVSPGTYSLAAVNPGGAPPKEAFIGVYIDPAQTGGTGGRTGFYYTGDGTLTLDSLDAEHAWGSFSMRGLELDALAAPTGAEVQITGTFHAVHTDAFGDEEAFWW